MIRTVSTQDLTARKWYLTCHKQRMVVYEPLGAREACRRFVAWMLADQSDRLPGPFIVGNERGFRDTLLVEEIPDGPGFCVPVDEILDDLNVPPGALNWWGDA